jgi:hypothetical protein
MTLLGPEAALMADVNQAWDLPHALAMLSQLDGHGLAWLEEPLRTDSSLADWQQLQGRLNCNSATPRSSTRPMPRWPVGWRRRTRVWRRWSTSRAVFLLW